MKLFHHIFLLCTLLLALALRMGHLITLLDTMPDATILCGGDGSMYNDQAQEFLAGTWPANNPFVSIPLYPFFLALVYSIFGVNYFIPLLIQISLGVLSCAILYQIGKLAFSKLTGVLAALIMAISGPVFLYQVCYAQVAITIPLLLLFIYFFFKFYDANQKFYLSAAGGGGVRIMHIEPPNHVGYRAGSFNVVFVGKEIFFSIYPKKHRVFIGIWVNHFAYYPSQLSNNRAVYPYF